jgi:hypothetical protein
MCLLPVVAPTPTPTPAPSSSHVLAPSASSESAWAKNHRGRSVRLVLAVIPRVVDADEDVDVVNADVADAFVIVVVASLRASSSLSSSSLLSLCL